MKIGTIDINKAYFGTLELTSSNAFLGEVKVIENEPVIEYSGLTFTSSGDSTIGLAKKADAQSLSYSTDLVRWTEMTTSTSINLSNNQRVFIRGYLSGNNTGSSNWTQFTITGNVTAKGNLNYIWDYNNPDSELGLKYRCGLSLFSGCIGLVDASELTLPSTTLTGNCYQYMFNNCTNLISAPSSLPATTLNIYCYSFMFNGCTSLINVPDILPAMSLTSNCYENMFRGCTSLTTAPVLPAKTLGGSSYGSMFNGCSSLNYIKCLATNIGDSTQWWVVNVSPTGTFVKDANMTSWTRNTSGIPTGWTVVDAITDYSGLTFTSSGNSTVGLAKLSTNQTLEYAKYGDDEWKQMTTATTVSLSDGEEVYIRGTLTDNNTSSNNTQFVMTGNIKASGNMNYIWNYQDPSAALKENCGRAIFLDCTALTDASGLTLPSTTLATECYRGMFNNCTSLASAPALPATTLADGCYRYMFSACQLTTAPELPATALTQYCYSSMFSNCTSLINVPSTLPALTAATACYYNMFHGCNKLTTAPAIYTKTLAASSHKTMFSGCTSLNSIKCLATDISANNCTQNWVEGVAATGTFTKNPNMTSWTTGTNGIPSGWSVVDNT